MSRHETFDLDRIASGGRLTDDGDVLALVGGDDPGEQLDAGERGHGDLGEDEVEGVCAAPHHLPRLHPVRDRRHCRPSPKGRERGRERGVRTRENFPWGLTTGGVGKKQGGEEEEEEANDSPR